MIPPPDSGVSGAVQRFAETAALWRVGRAAAGDVVEAAVVVVLADGGGLAVAELAGTPAVRAQVELPELLAGACAELGVVDVERETARSVMLAGAALAARLLRGEVEPEALTFWAHTTFQHRGPEPMPELARLEDQYRLLANLDDDDPYLVAADVDRSELDALTRLVARRLVDAHPLNEPGASAS